MSCKYRDGIKIHHLISTITHSRVKLGFLTDGLPTFQRQFGIKKEQVFHMILSELFEKTRNCLYWDSQAHTIIERAMFLPYLHPPFKISNCNVTVQRCSNDHPYLGPEKVLFVLQCRSPPSIVKYYLYNFLVSHFIRTCMIRSTNDPVRKREEMKGWL